jgi:hypothetical protein
MTQPTVYIVMGDKPMEKSAIGYDVKGEIIETVDWKDGMPDWAGGGICDYRGPGGMKGVQQLAVALDLLESNARVVGFDIVRIPA